MSTSPHGPAGGFERFAAEEFAELVRYAFRFSRDRADAEDLVQEALLRTYRHWPVAVHAPHGYTRTVILNLARDNARATALRPRSLPLADHDSAVDDASEQIARIAFVQDGLRQLSPGQRAVLVLRFWEDLSIEQTATRLGCSTGTVKSQTARAIAALRRVITEGDSPTGIAHVGP